MPQSSVIAPFRRMDGEPVFDDAWQAEVLAMAQVLIDTGVITAADWADGLGAALREVQVDDESDTVQNYYLAALTALERLLVSSGISAEDMDAQKQAWVAAYRATPHGEPVKLKS